MSDRADEQVCDLIVKAIKLDLLPIFECQQLVPDRPDMSRVKSRFREVTRPARDLVVLVRTLDEEMRRRRVVTCLLIVDRSTVLAMPFVGLSENWVERFLEPVFKIEVRQGANDCVFHPLDQTRFECGLVPVDTETARHSSLHFQHRTRRHAFDWKTNSRQIERAI